MKITPLTPAGCGLRVVGCMEKGVVGCGLHGERVLSSDIRQFHPVTVGAKATSEAVRNHLMTPHVTWQTWGYQYQTKLAPESCIIKCRGEPCAWTALGAAACGTHTRPHAMH